MKLKLHRLVNRPIFTQVVMSLIIVNAILVGLESYPAVYDAYFPWIQLTDRILLWAFTIEILLRLFVSRPLPSFFRDGWNVFDFVIVLSGHLFAGSAFITVLRLLRVLRVLRAISILPSLRRIVNALLMTLPSLGNISLLLAILFYIFAVSGTMLFGKAAPEYFGSLHATLLTLFQVITLESWASGVMRPLLVAVPWAWLYFVLFILFGTFIVMNLLIGVIVTNLDKANGEDDHKQQPSADEQLASLRTEIAELKQMIKQLSTDNSK
ncbi:ion transporter [Paenibacillus tarimensis]